MSPRDIQAEPSEDDRSDQSPTLERFLMHYFEDSALWPIVVVIVGHLVAISSFTLLTAIRERKLSAMLGGALLVYGSFLVLRWEYRQHRRPGKFALLLAITWILSGLIAYLGDLYKFL